MWEIVKHKGFYQLKCGNTLGPIRTRKVNAEKLLTRFNKELIDKAVIADEKFVRDLYSQMSTEQLKRIQTAFQLDLVGEDPPKDCAFIEGRLQRIAEILKLRKVM